MQHDSAASESLITYRYSLKKRALCILCGKPGCKCTKISCIYIFLFCHFAFLK